MKKPNVEDHLYASPGNNIMLLAQRELQKKIQYNKIILEIRQENGIEEHIKHTKNTIKSLKQAYTIIDNHMGTFT